MNVGRLRAAIKGLPDDADVDLDPDVEHASLAFEPAFRIYIDDKKRGAYSDTREATEAFVRRTWPGQSFTLKPVLLVKPIG